MLLKFSAGNGNVQSRDRLFFPLSKDRVDPVSLLLLITTSTLPAVKG